MKEKSFPQSLNLEGYLAVFGPNIADLTTKQASDTCTVILV